MFKRFLLSLGRAWNWFTVDSSSSSHCHSNSSFLYLRTKETLSFLPVIISSPNLCLDQIWKQRIPLLFLFVTIPLCFFSQPCNFSPPGITDLVLRLLILWESEICKSGYVLLYSDLQFSLNKGGILLEFRMISWLKNQHIYSFLFVSNLIPVTVSFLIE